MPSQDTFVYMRFVSKISQYDLTCTWTDSNPMIGFIISCPEANR